MVRFKQASLDSELLQILDLQQQNLSENLTQEEKSKEGFLTVEHTFGLLRKMNDVSPHTIAVDGDRVVGYALSMHPKFGNEINVLKPMFNEISKSNFCESDYIVMGQICIAKEYRGKGIFRELYQKMKQFLSPTFNKIITEVDAKNVRSLNAHYTIGFTLLKRYISKEKEWHLIVWE
ncbi:GNAT family N-acetyltransferase [Allomuricauda sp. SCSIO 65647]|uniref:GNAT family N-acetyltransferase n=1 Tax=Allomuricauda sp. SCSIO 65647 TaxID=2908843 RepID=UPI001F3CCCAF|nr:GNAT family N-acetyltransferase [Muricauda sp. SCSIO 65647]UJH66118.1 GNAT family N-acetyltransferase [Muricauda sp. SCSIO 65647]